jgi:hypothetical protein
VRQRLADILQRSIDSLAGNSDVLESDVAQWLIGCHGCGNVMEGRQEACNLCGALDPELEWFGPFYIAPPEPLGQLVPEGIVGILEGIPGQVADAILEASENVLSHRPTPQEWCAKEIVGHMIETHHLFVRLVGIVLQDSDTPNISPPVPPWELQEGKGYEAMGAADLVWQLQAACATSLGLLQDLTPEQWSRRGSHADRTATVLDLGSWLANHDRGHLAQVRRLCGKD